MSPHSRTICHISKIPSEIRQLITSKLSGKSTLQAESIELDSALDFGCLDEGLDFVSRLPPLEALLKDLPGETQLELTEAHRLIEIELTARSMSSTEVHGRKNRAWERRELRIAKAEASLSKLAAAETAHDGWYLAHTNLPIARADVVQVQGHYKNLLEVEESFCELKSYLQSAPSSIGSPKASSTMRASDTNVC